MKIKWYRPVLYAGACVIHRFLLFLPRPLVRSVATFFGLVACVVLRKERARACSHISQAFKDTYTDTEVSELVRKMFINLSLTAFDFALFPRFSSDQLKRLVTVEGIDKAYDIRKRRQQGAVLVTAHLGNWEMLGATLINAYGLDGVVVGKRIYYPRYNDLVIRFRESQKVFTVFRDSSPKELLRVLKRGDMVGILPDQDVADVDGVYVDFFGKPAYTPSGPAKLALTAKVPILLAFNVHEKGRYRLFIDSVIEPTLLDGESKQDAIQRITQQCSRVIERYIRQYPDQWVWMHRRWKTQKDEG